MESIENALAYLGLFLLLIAMIRFLSRKKEPKYLTKLQVVKRNDLFVVQIHRQRFFTRRWYWQDMHTCLRTPQPPPSRLETKNGYQPLPATKFQTELQADQYCTTYLQEKKNREREDIVVRSYNTSIENIVHRPMPPCKNPRIEFGVNEFCESIGCEFYGYRHDVPNVCTPENCKMTAHSLLGFLDKNGFKIIKE